MTWVGGSTLDRVAADAETVFACVGLGAGVTVIARRPRDRDETALAIEAGVLRAGILIVAEDRRARAAAVGVADVTGRAGIAVIARRVGRGLGLAGAAVRVAEVSCAFVAVVADLRQVLAFSGVGIAAVGRAGVAVVAVDRRVDALPASGAEAHRPGRASGHPRQRATGRPDVVDPVGDVEEAVDGPLSAGGLRQGRLTWARQAEIGPRSDAQQVEVRITRDLAGEPEQEGGECLHRVAQCARAVLCLGIDRHADGPAEASQGPGARQVQAQGGAGALLLAAQRAAGLVAIHAGDRRHEGTECARSGAGEAAVLGGELDGTARWQTIQNHQWALAHVAATLRRQIGGALAVVRHNASLGLAPVDGAGVVVVAVGRSSLAADPLRGALDTAVVRGAR